MKNSKHTAGPWQANDMGLVYSTAAINDENGAQLIADCGDENLTVEEILANARLIAKAPELLESLEEIVKYYAGNDKKHETHPVWRAHLLIAEAKGA